VQEEASQELIDGQSHQPLLVAVSGVAPAKSYVALGESNQPAVGNGNAVGVGTEMAQRVFWPSERALGVDDPVVAEQYPQPRGAVAVAGAQSIPTELRGKWVIEREVPTSPISRWGEKEAKIIVGTEIEYMADSFRWKHIVVNRPTVNVTLLSAEPFHDENSG